MGTGMGEDDAVLVCLARGVDRRGGPVAVPDDVRADAARRLARDGLLTAEELAGLPLDDLFDIVATRRRERGTPDEATG